MVRNIILSLFFTASLLAINCDAPSDDIDDLLNCAKSDILSINPQARVYTQRILVPKDSLDPEYYDFVMSKYNEIFLKIKAELALKTAMNFIVEEIVKQDNKIPKSFIEDYFTREIERQKRISENRAENGFLDHLLISITGNDNGMFLLSPTQEEEIKLKTNHIISSKEFKEKMIKSAKEEIAGLIPYENYILINRNNQTELGVVAYTSDKSREFAYALAKGFNIPYTNTATHCRSIDEVIKTQEKDENSLKFGLKFFYDDECQPAIVSYGLDTYSLDSADDTSEISSYVLAKRIAINSLKDFTSSSVYTYLNAEELADLLEQAYVILLHTKKYKSFGKTNVANSFTFLENFFNKSAEISLDNIHIAKKWSKKYDDYVTTGMIVYFSPTKHKNSK